MSTKLSIFSKFLVILHRKNDIGTEHSDALLLMPLFAYN